MKLNNQQDNLTNCLDWHTKGNRRLLYTNKIKSRQPAVTCVVAGMEARLLDIGLDADQTSEICLVVAEALNNVVEHAYRYAEDGDIEIFVSLDGLSLTIEINDFGPEFQLPSAPDSPRVEAQDLESLPEGGFGWNLILALTDEVSLTRKKSRNYLKISKKIMLPASRI